VEAAASLGMLLELLTSWYMEANHAISCIGELMLTLQYIKHCTTADCWKQMTVDQQRKAS